jgi:hypothetical protein
MKYATYGGLVVEPQNHPATILRVWPQNLRHNSMGIEGGTWIHCGGCAEEKQIRDGGTLSDLWFRRWTIVP